MLEGLSSVRKSRRSLFAVMAARSVWSELRIRVIEPRKFDVRWSLPACVREGSTDSRKVSPSLYAWQATRVLVRPGSLSRAEKYWDSLGTCDSQDVLPACGQRPQTSRRLAFLAVLAASY